MHSQRTFNSDEKLFRSNMGSINSSLIQITKDCEAHGSCTQVYTDKILAGLDEQSIDSATKSAEGLAGLLNCFKTRLSEVVQLTDILCDEHIISKEKLEEIVETLATRNASKVLIHRLST